MNLKQSKKGNEKPNADTMIKDLNKMAEKIQDSHKINYLTSSKQAKTDIRWKKTDFGYELNTNEFCFQVKNSADKYSLYCYSNRGDKFIFSEHSLSLDQCTQSAKFFI